MLFSPACARMQCAFSTHFVIGLDTALLVAFRFTPTSLPAPLLISWSNLITTSFLRKVRHESFPPVRLKPSSIADVILNRLQYMSGMKCTLLKTITFLDPSFWTTLPLNFPTLRILRTFPFPTLIPPDSGWRSYIPWIDVRM